MPNPHNHTTSTENTPERGLDGAREVASERDTNIIELTLSGLSAVKVKERLGLDISHRRVQAIANKHLGNVSAINNSQANLITNIIRPAVFECMRRLGKDEFMCEICKERQAEPCELHHTKYDGATIYDLMFVCKSCNKARVNRGLS